VVGESINTCVTYHTPNPAPSPQHINNHKENDMTTPDQTPRKPTEPEKEQRHLLLATGIAALRIFAKYESVAPTASDEWLDLTKEIYEKFKEQS
jgi:hypothetical protein